MPDSHDYDYSRQINHTLDKARLCLKARVKHELRRHGSYWVWLRRRMGSKSRAIRCTLLPQIPKKRPPKLMQRTEIEGYGMRALTRLAVYKIIAMFVVWQSGSIAFLIYWLSVHKGDLQDAFAPITTTMAGFVIYLAILDRFVKR